MKDIMGTRMNKSRVSTIIFVVLILIAGFLTIQYKNHQVSPITKSSVISPAATMPSASPSQSSFSYTCSPNTNVFESLQKSATSVKYQSSSYGKLVTEINGMTQGNSKYWIYSVNGKEATVGAEAYQCQGNEKIDWELK